MKGIRLTFTPEQGTVQMKINFLGAAPPAFAEQTGGEVRCPPLFLSALYPHREGRAQASGCHLQNQRVTGN